MRKVLCILCFLAECTLADSMAFQESMRLEFEEYQQQQEKEFDSYKKIIQQEFKSYKKELSKVWESPNLTSQHKWVWYSKDLKSRAEVDFENDTVFIETQDEKKTIQSILTHLLLLTKNAAFKEDVLSQRIEKKSKALVPNIETAVVSDEYILNSLLAYENLKTADVKQLSAELTDNINPSARTNSKGMVVSSASITLSPATNSQGIVDDPQWVKNRVLLKAKPYQTDVKNHSQKYQVEEGLIYAIIETESSFNPMARSPVPAYGLMQIVPRTAGIDASRRVYGESKIFAPSYLYESSQNIELGAAYLNVLYYRYLRKIENPQTRLYCTIAAYNTGTTNVAKALTGIPSVNKSAAIINTMSADQVYAKLIEKLPSDETKHYLKKVISRMPKYAIEL